MPVLVVIGVGFNLLVPVFTLIWLQTPFPGALFSPRLVVSAFHNPQWPALAAGILQPGDQLLAIDGVPVASGSDLSVWLRDKNVGQTVTVTVADSQNIGRVTITR